MSLDMRHRGRRPLHVRRELEQSIADFEARLLGDRRYAFSQNDMSIANASGATVRADVNSALQALASNSSGTSAPSTMYAYMFWADTTNGQLKQRNAANSAWILRGTLAETIVAARSSNTILAAADHGKTINCTSSFTQTLTAVATLGDGWWVYVKNSGTGVITLDPNSTETIDGATTVALYPGDGCWLICNGSAFITVGRAGAAPIARGHIDGLVMSTAGSSATMTIAAGQAADSTNAVLMTLSAAISKTTSAWAVGSTNGGLDTGAIANSTWYHFFEIMRPDTGVVDVLFSLSATAPTMPSNYTYKRRIGSGKTNGSAQWVLFTQDGDYFRWSASVLDINTNNPGTSAVTATLASVPTGVNVFALINAALKTTSTDRSEMYLRDLAASDEAPSGTAGPLATVTLGSDAGLGEASWGGRMRTNTSGQIGYRLSVSTATLTARIATLGWEDTRGKDA